MKRIHPKWLDIKLIAVTISSFALLLVTAHPTVALQEQETTPQKRKLILVVGASGTPDYGEMFADWSNRWETTASSAGFDVARVGGKAKSDSTVIRDQLKQQIEASLSIDTELWLVLIGHGTFDGAEAKFNLAGEDVSATQLNEWLKPRAKAKRSTVIVNCSSASGPFCTILKSPNRIILTSTRNGYEFAFSHFGKYMAEAISETNVDLDKDQQTSLLEAAIVAHGKTSEFYKSDSRLATENAIVEDNGDGKGTPLSWFTGIRVTKRAKDGTAADGLRANQVFLNWNPEADSLARDQAEKRNQLERQIDELRSQKKNLTEDQYFTELEKLMLQVAKLYEQADETTRSAKQ